MRGTLSNLGYKVAMSATGVTPKTTDLLNGWESKSPTKTTANTVENNRVDGDGYSRHTALIKTWDPITIKFWKDDADTFTRLKTQYAKSTSAEDFYVDFTFIAPKTTEFSSVKDYTLNGQIVGFEEGAANTTDAQNYTITFQPSGAPTDFVGPLATS